MSMNFSDAENGQGGDFELIPAGTLLWAYVNVRSMEKSKAGNEYLDIELTVSEGPYARRKLWDMVGIAGSDQYVNIGRSQIKAILESGRGAGPDNQAGYQIEQYTDLNSLKVAIKTRIEKGGVSPAGGNYADKVRPVYLSPNPTGSTSKAFSQLMASGSGAPAITPQTAPPPAPQQAPAAPTSWGGSTPMPTTTAGAPAKPSWL